MGQLCMNEPRAKQIYFSMLKAFGGVAAVSEVDMAAT